MTERTSTSRVAWAKHGRRLGMILLLTATGVFAARRYHAVDRLLPRDEVPTFEAKRAPFVRRVTADGYLRAVKATPLAAPVYSDGAQKIAWMAPDGTHVHKGDVVIRFDPSEFEKNLRDGQADQASAAAKIEKERVLADSAVRGRDRTAALSAVELKETRTFQSTDREIFSRNQIIESAIDEGLSTSRMNHADQAKGIEGALSQSKVDLIGVEKKKGDLKVSHAQQSLRGLEVRAPHDGIIVFEPDWRGNLPHVGDSVFGGQTIASLPLLDDMEAEVFVLEADAAGLLVGTTASVVLEAHPEPPFDAKVRRIDTLAKPRIREVPIQYFGATLELARTDRERMKPGQRIHATLVLDTKDALSVPRQTVFERDGKTVVYRSQGGRFEPTVVKLGGSSLGLVVIEEGLADGDHIALRDPTRPTRARAQGEGEASKEGNKPAGPAAAAPSPGGGE